MKQNKAPAFQLFAGDLLSDTMTWTAQELGVHIRLMCWSWINGPLPADLSRVNRIDPCSEAVWPTVGTKWTLTDDGYTNTRLEQSRNAQTKYREAQRERGLASARARSMRTDGGQVKVEFINLDTRQEQPHEVAKKERTPMAERVATFTWNVTEANAKRPTGGEPSKGPLPGKEVAAFVAYWTQAEDGAVKFLAERQRVFDIPKRLTLWASKVNWAKQGTTMEKQQAMVMPRTAAIETKINTNRTP